MKCGNMYTKCPSHLINCRTAVWTTTAQTETKQSVWTNTANAPPRWYVGGKHLSECPKLWWLCFHVVIVTHDESVMLCCKSSKECKSSCSWCFTECRGQTSQRDSDVTVSSHLPRLVSEIETEQSGKQKMVKVGIGWQHGVISPENNCH